LQGDRQDQNEFTIERGPEMDAAGRSRPRGASSSPRDKRHEGQPEFELGGTTTRQSDRGMPEQLRRKYYVAETGVGDEAKVYADPRGEYLAFKIKTERMATRLEDAGVIRDMVSIAQHRNWTAVELRGSEEFRRTAWLEASVRGIAVRGYEPDPVDRAALSFRTTAAHQVGSTSQPRQREPEASETISVAGVSTKRPIEVNVLPPERTTARGSRRNDGTASSRSQSGSVRPSSRGPEIAEEPSLGRLGITIDVVPQRSEMSHQSSRTGGKRRAEIFRSGDHRETNGDDTVKAARSQLAAIERALNKAVLDPKLRRSVLDHAKELIAEKLERGGEFKRAGLRESTTQREVSPGVWAKALHRSVSKATEVTRER